MILYKIVNSQNGFRELEEKVTGLIAKGWKPIGGVSFNMGYCYQAMIGRETKKEQNKTPTNQEVGANSGMKRVDDLT